VSPVGGSGGHTDTRDLYSLAAAAPPSATDLNGYVTTYPPPPPPIGMASPTRDLGSGGSVVVDTTQASGWASAPWSTSTTTAEAQYSVTLPGFSSTAEAEAAALSGECKDRTSPLPSTKPYK
jgi:hypothetical protein